ncbi:MAG: hypothetical protein IPK68_23545 [Bdellovibrionales bacterium]|nr:hypothetical protein [Bdellovibrionales bacterium]
MIVFTSLFCWVASADFIDSFKDYRTYYLVEPISPQGTKLMILLTRGNLRRELVPSDSLPKLEIDGTPGLESDVLYSEASDPPPPQLILPDSNDKSNQGRLENWSVCEIVWEALSRVGTCRLGINSRAASG